jgi:hypothetical protein
MESGSHDWRGHFSSDNAADDCLGLAGFTRQPRSARYSVFSSSAAMSGISQQWRIPERKGLLVTRNFSTLRTGLEHEWIPA